MTAPRDIAVVVPCYNLGRTVEEAVDSVLMQARPAAEIIVVDDGSSDIATRQVLLRMRRPRTRVVAIRHSGVSAARNHGVGLTRSPYLLLLDADDVLAPNYLEKAGACLDTREELSFVSCAVQAFEGASYIWTPPSLMIIDSLTHGTVHASTMFRRTLWDAVGGFDRELPGYEDMDLWLRALSMGFRGEILDEPLLFYRVREQSRYRQALEPEHYEAAMQAIVAKHQELLASHGLDVLRSKEHFLVQILGHQESLARERDTLRAEDAALTARIEAVRSALAGKDCDIRPRHGSGPKRWG